MQNARAQSIEPYFLLYVKTEHAAATAATAAAAAAAATATALRDFGYAHAGRTGAAAFRHRAGWRGGARPAPA